LIPIKLNLKIFIETFFEFFGQVALELPHNIIDDFKEDLFAKQYIILLHNTDQDKRILKLFKMILNEWMDFFCLEI
jgi:hypothetical protein